jgi:hypothetical protein
MSIVISVVPASTRAGQATISALLSLEDTLKVHGLYRDLSKVPPEFSSHPKFTSSQGTVASNESMDFSGSDAVFYIPPPPEDSPDVGEAARQYAINVRGALKRAKSVKRLVLFSSMGAQHDNGIVSSSKSRYVVAYLPYLQGILRINHLSDNILRHSAEEVVIPKPGYFQESWAHAFQTSKADPPVFYSPVSPADHKVPMVSLPTMRSSNKLNHSQVSLIDVGKVCAQKLLETGRPLPTNPHFFDLYGPRNYSALDVKMAIEQVTGRPTEAVVIPKEQLAEFYSQTYPPNMIGDVVEMTEAALPGGIMVTDFEGDENTVRGDVELVDALQKIYQ